MAGRGSEKFGGLDFFLIRRVYIKYELEGV